jgi:hypothetical protein
MIGGRRYRSASSAVYFPLAKIARKPLSSQQITTT